MTLLEREASFKAQLVSDRGLAFHSVHSVLTLIRFSCLLLHWKSSSWSPVPSFQLVSLVSFCFTTNHPQIQWPRTKTLLFAYNSVGHFCLGLTWPSWLEWLHSCVQWLACSQLGQWPCVFYLQYAHSHDGENSQSKRERSPNTQTLSKPVFASCLPESSGCNSQPSPGSRGEQYSLPPGGGHCEGFVVLFCNLAHLPS